MDALTVLNRHAEQTGWDDASKLSIALAYIDELYNNSFEEFVGDWAREEMEDSQ